MHNTTEQLEVAVHKNRDQAKLLKQLENQLRGVENELDQAVLERDSLENQHISLSSENKALDGELDSVLRQILEYERVNQELQKEVEHYIQCDEQARSKLNRKDNIHNLMRDVAVRLSKTGDVISHLR